MNRDWQPLWLVPAVALVAPAAHGTQYLTTTQAQKLLFADASRFAEHPLTLTDAQKDAIRKLSGVRQRQDSQPVWSAMKDGERLGWFIVDDVVGKHEYITYAAALSPQGEVIGVEILNYRETHGGEVRQADWRANFAGKSLQDTLRLGRDIPNISGATLSCRNLTDGVRRLLALQQVALRDA
ncbi:MAG: FMN-binding protein [Alcanivorax sp.]|nr:FMN-binding protein [Alcanivorax sp.]